ncbi:MAG: hypothetical protein WC908_03430 [Candidatus Paceibacterota bacterium]
MLTKDEEQQLTKLVIKAKEKCKNEYGVEIKKPIQIDTSKSFEQNKVLIVQAIKDEKDLQLKDKPKTTPSAISERKKQSALEQAKKNEELQRMKAEEQKLVAEWKATPPQDVQIPEFETAKHLILATAKGDGNATLITGEGGIGKTFLAINTIKAVTKDFEFFNGYTTPLSFYKFLYGHREKLILLDDVEGIFNDEKGMALLKGALWDADGKRIINYASTSDKAEGLPSMFEFKGKLIMLCNKVPRENDISVSAMISRTISYELSFSHLQKKRIMYEILDKKQGLTDEQKRLAKQVIDKHTNLITKHFNFRTLERLLVFIRYNPTLAEQLFTSTIKQDEDETIVWELMNSQKGISEQIAVFHQLTGKCRRTFYNIKRGLQKQMEADRKSAKVQPKGDVAPAQNEGGQ